MLFATALVASLAIPAFAKLANVTVTATAVPSAVTPGKNVAIDVQFYNSPSTSNISQLYLTASAPPSGWIFVGVEKQSQGGTSCIDVSTAAFTCSLGAVPAGTAATVRVVYTTPSTANGAVNIDWFYFNTTGVAGDKHGNSHGDNYPAPGTVIGTVMLDNTLNYGGAYTATAGEEVSDSQVLHASRNPQYTSVKSPKGAIAIFVSESNEVDCPAGYPTCFGQWSHITVDYGASFGTGFSVILGYKGNIGNANFIHVLDDGGLEPIDTTCSSKDTPTTIPCKWIESANGNTLATLWLTQNGLIKAY